MRFPTDVAGLIHAHPTQNEALGEAHLALAGKPLHSHADRQRSSRESNLTGPATALAPSRPAEARLWPTGTQRGPTEFRRASH